MSALASAQGTFTTYGSSSPGTGNPQIANGGDPRLGNLTFTIQMTGGQAAVKSGTLLLGTKLDPPSVVAGVTLHVSPIVSVPFNTNSSGAATIPFPLPGDDALHGIHLFAQFVVQDTGGAGGLAASKGADVWLGGYSVTPPRPAEPALPIGSTTYYVDSDTGNDGNDGLTPSTPSKTLRHAVHCKMDPSGGDKLVIKGTFQERLEIAGFNGDDVANRPSVFVADVSGAELDGNCPRTLLGWPFDEDGDDAGIVGGVGYLDVGIRIAGSNQIYVRGLDVIGFADHAVLARASNDVTLTQLNTKWIGRNAMYLTSDSSESSVEGLVVAHCTMDMSNLGRWTNKPAGFSIASECLTLDHVLDYDVYANHLSNTFMEGICPKPGSSGKIHYNLVEQTRAVGIYLNESSNCTVSHNIVRNVGWFDDGETLRHSLAVWEDLWDAAELFGTEHFVAIDEQGSTGILVGTGDLGAFESTGLIEHVVVTENVVAWTRKNGIACFNDPCAHADMDDIRVENNVVYGACQNTSISNAALAADYTQTNSVFANNIVANSGTYGAIVSGNGTPEGSTSISHTLFYANASGNYPSAQSATWGGDGMISVDPLFVLAPNDPGDPDDFALDDESPAIDSGVSNGLVEVGSHKDRGAYEFGAFRWLAGP